MGCVVRVKVLFVVFLDVRSVVKNIGATSARPLNYVPTTQQFRWTLPYVSCELSSFPLSWCWDSNFSKTFSFVPIHSLPYTPVAISLIVEMRFETSKLYCSSSIKYRDLPKKIGRACRISSNYTTLTSQQTVMNIFWKLIILYFSFVELN